MTTPSDISVIIPTYNRGDFLGKAIRSVLAQTRPCSELLVIDDGSEDNTAIILREFQGQDRFRLRYIRQHNQGAAAARNTGIRAAQGDLLCFLDSDDCFQPDKLEIQAGAMDNEPRYLVSHTREIWYRRGQILNQKKKHQPPHGKIFSKCLPICVVGMSTVMAQRQLFVEYGFFEESLPCCEDYDFWLRVAVEEEFLLVDKPLTVKNGGRPDQLSVIHRMGMDRFRIKALCMLLDSGRLSAEQYALSHAELMRKCRIYGNGCIKHGRHEEGERYLDIPELYPEIIPKNKKMR